MIFRELHNSTPTIEIKLNSITTTRLELKNLMNDRVETKEVQDGAISLTITEAPGYRFLEYRRQSNDESSL